MLPIRSSSSRMPSIDHRQASIVCLGTWPEAGGALILKWRLIDRYPSPCMYNRVGARVSKCHLGVRRHVSCNEQGMVSKLRPATAYDTLAKASERASMSTVDCARLKSQYCAITYHACAWGRWYVMRISGRRVTLHAWQAAHTVCTRTIPLPSRSSQWMCRVR